jgi:hypothetical protein
MARAQVKEGKLRGCPTCGTPVSSVDIGLRDFRWVNEALPGKLGFMDVDGCLTQASTRRVLVMEMKPKGEYISRGARLTYAIFATLPKVEVWYAWDEGEGWVTMAKANPDGSPGHRRRMRRTTLARKVRAWWDLGLEKGDS